VSTQTIKSDANGNIDFDFKALGEGSYVFSLEESNTTGYLTLGTFWGKASVSAAGAVQAEVTDITNIPDNTSVKVDDSKAIINVTNYSERAQMTVTKVWTDKTNKEVTIQLMRNGVLVNGMTKTLSASNNWTDTWTDLPLYVDGAKATYSVREIQIGKTGEGDTRQYNTTDDPTDGYADYIVTVSGTTQTVDSNKNVSYSVTVQNTKDNGQVVFTKVNGSGQALAGAEFTVYIDKNCTTPATITGTDGNETPAVFTSDANGIVTIVGLEPNTYYVKETKAPSGYQPGDTVYILNAKANNSSLVDASGSKVNQVLNEPLEVALSLVKRATGSGETAPNLTGAEFDLYDAADYNDTTGLAANATAIEHITSEADAVKFTAKLGVGSYVLIETKAPEGYNLLTTAIHFSIDGEGKVEILNPGTAEAVQDTQDNSLIPYQWTITVYNTTGQTLPNTGGIGTTPLYAFGVTAIGAALLMFGLRKRSRERGVE
jgi:LPXTG-motif cell wall-anchored protein